MHAAVRQEMLRDARRRPRSPNPNELQKARSSGMRCSSIVQSAPKGADKQRQTHRAGKSTKKKPTKKHVLPSVVRLWENDEKAGK